MTEGPQLILVTVTPTPKLCSVCCNLMAVALYSSSEKAFSLRTGFFNRSIDGNMYSFSGSFFAISCATDSADSPSDSVIVAFTLDDLGAINGSGFGAEAAASGYGCLFLDAAAGRGGWIPADGNLCPQ